MIPRYLRVSVTGRCNLRCVYCGPRGPCEPGMPAEFTPRQIAHLVRCSAAEGVRKVRLTGGEPLLRDDLEDIVACVSGIPGIAETALTSNGVGLARRASALKEAGLDRINISLDTLRPDRFIALTGFDLHEEVLAGIQAASRAFGAVKLNVVLVRGVNDDEVEAMVLFAAERGLHVRFIESYLSQGAPLRNAPVHAGEIRDGLRALFGPLRPLPAEALSVEETYVLPSAGGVRVGIIASASGAGCPKCSKLRFTAAGQLRPCLFAAWGVDVAAALRCGDTRSVREAIRRVAARKRLYRCAALPITPDPVRYIGG